MKKSTPDVQVPVEKQPVQKQPEGESQTDRTGSDESGTSGTLSGRLPLLQRVQLRHPSLSPLPPLSLDKRQQIVTCLSGIDVRRGGIICHTEDWKNWVFLYILSQFKGSVALTCENAYRLVETRFKELGDAPPPNFDAPLLALWMGYREPPHKSMTELIEYRMELAATRGPLRETQQPELPAWAGQALWIYYKGTSQQLRSAFPSLVSTTQQLKLPVLDLQTVLDEGDEDFVL